MEQEFVLHCRENNYFHNCAPYALRVCSQSRRWSVKSAALSILFDCGIEVALLFHGRIVQNGLWLCAQSEILKLPSPSILPKCKWRCKYQEYFGLFFICLLYKQVDTKQLSTWGKNYVNCMAFWYNRNRFIFSFV